MILFTAWNYQVSLLEFVAAVTSLIAVYLGTTGRKVMWPWWIASSALYAIAFTQVWFHTGQMMVIYIAGLQQIPQELYEAAEMDGASRWQQFRNVTWPMSIPTTIVVMAYTTIQSFRAFDLIFAMTQGGPNSSSNIFAVLIYQTLFNELRIGYAAAQSIFFILLLVFVTVLQRKFLNSRYEK
ncbi:MAG: ABC transporter permease subunit [Candidatus Nanopelagicaceae bacterium]